MKYLDEYRDHRIARALAAEIVQSHHPALGADGDLWRPNPHHHALRH